MQYYPIVWLVLFLSVCAVDYFEQVTNFERYEESYFSYTAYDASWTRLRVGYWMTGVVSGHNNNYEDRNFRFRYGRPQDPNTDYDFYQPTTTLPITGYDIAWERVCSSDYAIYSISSSHNNNAEDRLFTVTCKQLPEQFSTYSCTWTGYRNSFDSLLDFTCSTGIIRGIQSYHDNNKEDRRFKFYCCYVRNTPMDTQAVIYANVDTLVTQIYSDYKIYANTRETESKRYGKPLWYEDGTGNIVDTTYDLTNTYGDVYFWVRVCPRNGALTKVVQSNNLFSFECGVLIDDVYVSNCEWTDYINEFHQDGTGDCDKDGPIRGVQSYYSPNMNDRKFKIYCCDLNRGTYSVDTSIKIKAKTHSGMYAASSGTITFDLCWNNVLYQGVLIPNAVDTSFTTDDVVQYDSCGNERMMAVSTSSEDLVELSHVAVEDNGIDYIINEFDFYDTNTAETIHYTEFILDKDDGPFYDVIIKYPDNYLTACSDGIGCTGQLYNLTDYQQYLLTITLCGSFTLSGIPNLGVVLRGLNGNLDKTILTGPTFEEVPAGSGNIGDVIHINIEYESDPDESVSDIDFCIESITLHDPFGEDHEFGEDYFGDGIILSNSCSDDGAFRQLTDVQYVPCYDTPFSITTYEPSVYTSVQIHACDGAEGGIAAVNSGLLSLTIVGISRSDTFVSSNPLSLKSSTDWESGKSRDYTLQLSGDFDRMSLITITNNHPTALLCVDSVLINGEDAFLTNYWVGSTTGGVALQTIPAVLEWPICDIELTTTIKAETPLPTEPEAVATSTCVNRNRLVSVDCEIQQAFETYEEVIWEQETGSEVTTDIAIGFETSTTMSTSFTRGFDSATTINGGVGSQTNTVSMSATLGSERSWSSSVSVSAGVTQLDITTDGTVNGDTIGVECSASVSVPPSQQISYALIFDHTAATLTTLTDIKMIKCSAYLYGKDYEDPNDYIYIYGIEGQLTVKEATNCYVSFNQAEQVNADEITCGEERALATREFGTYVPLCDENDSDKYKKCQCAYGDSLTLPTCGCVDETTGNLLSTEKAAVVAETDTYTWSDWCIENCETDTSTNSSNSSSSAKVAAPLIDVGYDAQIKKISENEMKENGFENNFNVLGFIGLLVIGGAISLIGVTYAINSCISCYQTCQSKQHKSSFLYGDTDDDVEKA